jgi:hypothetical protein
MMAGAPSIADCGFWIADLDIAYRSISISNSNLKSQTLISNLKVQI